VNIKLSIIIPFYNIQSYLPFCLDSLKQLNGFTDEVEVIFVDDGSSDNSMKIVLDWIGSNKNIKSSLISQPNAGLSSARNTGFNNSIGSFVWFIDGDDFIATDAVSYLISEIKTSDFEVLKFQRYLVYPDGEQIQCKTIDSNIATNEVEVFFRMYLNNSIKSTVWDGIYSRNILLKIDFPVGKVHEDHFFTPQVLACASSIKVVVKPLYYYRKQRQGSIMEKFTFKRLHIVMATIELKNLLINIGLYNIFKIAYQKRLIRYIKSSIKLAFKKNSYYGVVSILIILYYLAKDKINKI